MPRPRISRRGASFQHALQAQIPKPACLPRLRIAFHRSRAPSDYLRKAKIKEGQKKAKDKRKSKEGSGGAGAVRA